jgi:hypothetical protein
MDGSAWAAYLSQDGFVGDLGTRGEKKCFAENDCQGVVTVETEGVVARSRGLRLRGWRQCTSSDFLARTCILQCSSWGRKGCGGRGRPLIHILAW